MFNNLEVRRRTKNGNKIPKQTRNIKNDVNVSIQQVHRTFKNWWWIHHENSEGGVKRLLKF